MTEAASHARLLETFATLADTLVDDYDVVDLLQTLVEACRDVLDVTAAGILLADERGDLELVASTSEASRLVEAHAARRGGRARASSAIAPARRSPCRASQMCRRTGPRSATSALAQGFASIDAIPLRLRETTIGTLNLLRTRAGAAAPTDLTAAQAFADVATIGILHERSLRESDCLRSSCSRA